MTVAWKVVASTMGTPDASTRKTFSGQRVPGTGTERKFPPDVEVVPNRFDCDNVQTSWLRPERYLGNLSKPNRAGCETARRLTSTRTSSPWALRVHALPRPLEEQVVVEDGAVKGTLVGAVDRTRDHDVAITIRDPHDAARCSAC